MKEGSCQQKDDCADDVAASCDALSAQRSKNQSFMFMLREEIEVERTIKEPTACSGELLFGVSLMNATKSAA